MCSISTARSSTPLLSSIPCESRFTGKERDSESGNDYFKYRYYASSMGRWLSPDPSGLTHADLGNPQSLNLYNYVGNRPLTLTDLDGLCWQGFQWACDLGNSIKNLVVETKNKIEYGQWTTNTRQAEIRSLDRYRAQNRQNSYQRETQVAPSLPTPGAPGYIDVDLGQSPYIPRLTVGPAPPPQQPRRLTKQDIKDLCGLAAEFSAGGVVPGQSNQDPSEGTAPQSMSLPGKAVFNAKNEYAGHEFVTRDITPGGGEVDPGLTLLSAFGTYAQCVYAATNANR
jgi:RHS repeat-associated protein